MRGNRRKRGQAGPLPVPRRQHSEEGRDDESRPSSVTLSSTRELAQTSFELRKGPIPDAEELVRYGRAHPDAPAIILGEFEAQAAHRRRMERRNQALEKQELEASITSERLGLACALVIALVGFGCGTYLVATGHGVEGTVIFGLDVGGLVSAFILGRPRAPQPAHP